MPWSTVSLVWDAASLLLREGVHPKIVITNPRSSQSVEEQAIDMMPALVDPKETRDLTFRLLVQDGHGETYLV